MHHVLDVSLRLTLQSLLSIHRPGRKLVCSEEHLAMKEKDKNVSAIHHKAKLQNVVNDYNFGQLSQTSVQLFETSP